MSSSTLPVLTPTIIQELLEKHREVLLSSLAKMLPAPASAPTSSAAPDTKGRKKKEKKPVDPDAPPKEKRPPNAWILFSTRVEELVRAAEAAAGTPKESVMKTVVVKQFSSYLKGQKAYEEWADDEITEAMTTWTPPEVSKQAAAKAASAAASVASDSASVASADVADAPAAEKPKRKWSEEAKAAAAAKRAANKENAAAAPAPAADADASAVAPAPVKKAIAIKPKKAAPAPEPAKKVDLSFFAWTHDGTDYYTNDRGDVVTTDWEWVGRFNGSVIESVSEPSDLSEATLRD
jgi:hypothetical protein